MARCKEFDEAEVLDRALQLFWSRGYHATSMQDLIEGLGISRSSLYDTYGDKRALFLAALNKYRQEQSSALVRLVKESTDIYATLRDLFAHSVSDACTDRQKKGCFLVNVAVELAPQDPEVAALVGENQKDIEEAFYRAIKKGQESGQISGHHPARALAKFIFNTSTGLRVNAKTGTDRRSMNEIVEVALSVLK